MSAPPGCRGSGPPGWLIGSLAALCLILALAAVGYYRAQRAAAFGETERMLQTVVSIKAEQVAAWRREQLDEVAHFSRSRVFSRLFARLLARDPGAPGELTEWIAPVLAENPSWRGPLLLDPGLAPIPTGGATEAIVLGEPGREHAAAALATGGPLLSELHRRSAGVPAHLDLVVPVGDARGRAQGLVFIRIDPATDLEALLPVRPAPSPSLEVLLVRADGDSVAIVGGPGAHADALQLPLSRPDLPEAAAARGAVGFFEGRDHRGTPVVAALAAVPESSWRLVAKIDRAEIDAQLRRLLLRTGGMAALLLLALTGAVGAIWERRHRRTASRLLAAERTGHAAATRYAALMRHANDGILLADDRLRIIDVNFRVEELTGYRREELLAMSVPELRTPAARADLEQTLEAARRADGGIYETVHQRKDGSAYPVEVSVRFLEEGGRRLLLAHLRDITERRRLERQALRLNRELEERVAARTAALEEANRELESFSYSVSHDLRAPLRAIEGFSGILLEEHGGELGPEARRLLGVVGANARRMSRLIDDLLSFSRLGRADLQAGTVDMGALAAAVIEEYRPAGGWGRVRWAIGELPPCRGDAVLLHQVWANLLGNALKFSAKREEARIGISGERRGGEVAYRVEDNGVGFDMQYADKLFGVFQRLHDPAQFEGTGVGLAIVQRIVHRHGGRVWAEGRPDGGATFSFTIPSGGADGGPGDD